MPMASGEIRDFHHLYNSYDNSSIPLTTHSISHSSSSKIP